MKNQTITKSETAADFEDFKTCVERETAEVKRKFDDLPENRQREMIEILDETSSRYCEDGTEKVVTDFLLDFKKLLLRGVKWQ